MDQGGEYLMQFELWKTVDLREGRAGTLDIGPKLFTEDINPMTVGIKLVQAGAAVTVEGTVTGKAIIADGSTVTLTGGKEENRAWVVIPQDALGVPGKIEIFLRISGESDGAVSLHATGTVVRSETPVVIVPGDPLPDVDEIRAAIEGAEAILNAGAVSATVSGTTLIIAPVVA